MNLNETPLLDDNNLMIPLQNYGVKWYYILLLYESLSNVKIYLLILHMYSSLSMGFLIDPNKPIIWRGPLVMSALQRLLKGTVWNPLDILLIDTPPGTGDVHLSLAQNVPISGTILISTPQKAALNVTKRGAEMYQTLKIPLIGLIENMSHVICTNCNEKLQIYPNSTEQLAEDLQIDILESIPIDTMISEGSDSGVPIVIKSPESNQSQSYKTIANKLLDFLNKKQ